MDLREGGHHHHHTHKHPGGQPHVPPVTVVEDICIGLLPDCTGELNNPFRRINGTCNNVAGSTGGKGRREVCARGGQRGGHRGGHMGGGHKGGHGGGGHKGGGHKGESSGGSSGGGWCLRC